MSQQDEAKFPAGKCQRELINTGYIDSQVRTIDSELPDNFKKEVKRAELMEIDEPKEENNEVSENESSNDILAMAIDMITDKLPEEENLATMTTSYPASPMADTPDRINKEILGDEEWLELTSTSKGVFQKCIELQQEGYDMNKIDMEITIHLAGSDHQTTWLHLGIDLPNPTRLKAVLDTGSSVSFLSHEVLSVTAPDLLNYTTPCPCRFAGIAGDSVHTYGMITVPCEIAGRKCNQLFVVADIVEGALLGLDFINEHKVSWDHWKNELKYGIPKDLQRCDLPYHDGKPNQ